MDDSAVTLERKRPAYELIAQTLRNAIQNRLLHDGTVLTEGALSTLFGASRSPIKQAFSELEAAKLVQRFEGRGVIVGQKAVEPIRIAITAETLGIASDPTEVVRDDAWSTLYYALERDIILASIFGRFRVNELALARHYGVGRTVARNLLLRAHALGLVVKADSSHWYIVEMNEERFRDLYELRILLEPPLIETATACIPMEIRVAIERRLRAAANDFAGLSVSELDALENDIHVTCLSYGRNIEMMEASKRTHCTLVIGKHMQAEIFKRPRIHPFIDEHLAILDAIKLNQGAKAAAALRKHLTESHIKGVARLAAFRAQRKVDMPPYVLSD